MDTLRRVDIDNDGGSQVNAGASGTAYQSGKSIYIMEGTDGFYWCVAGISEDGNAFESDDVGPFDDDTEAEEDALAWLDDIAWLNERCQDLEEEETA